MNPGWHPSQKQTSLVWVTTRRFPPPWTVEDIGAAFVVDSAGQLIVRPINQDFIILFAGQGSVSVSYL
jgi:hypothetical protein